MIKICSSIINAEYRAAPVWWPLDVDEAAAVNAQDKYAHINDTRVAYKAK